MATRYTIVDPKPLLARVRRGRGNFLGMTGSGPGSMQIQVTYRGYPEWTNVDPELADLLKSPVHSPRLLVGLARELSASLLPAYQEQMILFPVDRAQRVMGWKLIGIGNAGTVQVDPASVLRAALVAPGSAFLLVHNHPSGDSRPSAQDIALTERLLEASALVGVQFLDHLVIGRNSFTSLTELGYMGGQGPGKHR